MAIAPDDEYPGQTDTDPDYPYGKAQNVALAGDGTGTPWEERLVNDIFGFQQALLGAAGATPSGTPDNATTSQYLDAVIFLIKNTTFDNGARVEGSPLSLEDYPVFSPTKVVTRTQPLLPLAAFDAGSTIGGLAGLTGSSDPDWYFDPTLMLWLLSTVSGLATIPITNLVEDSTMTQVILTVKASGYGVLPSFRGGMQVVHVDGSNVIQTSNIQEDGAGSIGVYNTAHDITLTLDTPVTIDQQSSSPKAIYLRILGPDAISTWGLFGCTAVFETGSLRP